MLIVLKKKKNIANLLNISWIR